MATPAAPAARVIEVAIVCGAHCLHHIPKRMIRMMMKKMIPWMPTVLPFQQQQHWQKKKRTTSPGTTRGESLKK